MNSRVRIRTTGQAGSTEVLISSVADPNVQATLKLTTINATIQQVRLEGPSDFQLHVGQAVPIEVTAILSSGEVIPHAQYSSDLDLVTGSEYAAMVDGLGISALTPSPPNTPMAIGFFRGGGSASGTISVREMRLVNAQVRLGGNQSSSNDFKMPSGYQARLEVLGTFEDGTSRSLQFNQDYSVGLSGDPGFTFRPPGILAQPGPNQTATLNLDLPGTANDLAARVTSVDGSLLTSLNAEFENYPDDRRLLHAGQGYARELRVLADFPGLPQYRVSGFDPLTVNTAIASQGLSREGWPTLTPSISAGSDNVQLTLGGISTTLSGVSVNTPQSLAVSAVGKRPAGRLPLELGSHLSAGADLRLLGGRIRHPEPVSGFAHGCDRSLSEPGQGLHLQGPRRRSPRTSGPPGSRGNPAVRPGLGDHPESTPDILDAATQKNQPVASRLVIQQPCG
ncbi:MAG: hypothetical protein KF760_33685 [Candidatus Eremiobacteraeota bacterium]|nr:hypothetical protein [Candidatus Eremiobacteraeota bacterium]MCW5869855.1 hypothetical protein [Candidatus Eremiobacteraeota bacterium]